MSGYRWRIICPGVIPTVLLLFILAFPGVVMGAAEPFNDIRGHWAEKSMLEMNAYDIVHGYPGGRFLPDNQVTMLEAVVMIINTLGLNEKAGRVDLSGLQFHPTVSWGKGHLALAAERGMLTRQGLPLIDSRRLASRVEVASMVCLALGLPPAPEYLTFNDTADIPQQYRGYVGAVVKNKIIMGMPGNMFLPGMPVTRAQMCTILNRLIDRKMVAPPSSMALVRGRITEINKDEQKVTLRNLVGEKSVYLPTDLAIYTSTGTVSPTSLDKGKRLKCIADSQGRVRYASLLDESPPVDSRVEGMVVAFDRGDGGYSLTLENGTGDRVTYSVEDDALLEKGGQELDARDVLKEDYVEAGLSEDGRVVSIEVFTPQRIAATVVKVADRELTLRSRGREVTYDVSKQVRVTRNYIREMNYDELRQGDRVEAVVMNRTVFQIDCLSGGGDADQMGMVSRVRDDAVYLYVGKEEKRYELDNGAEVIKNGRTVDPDRLNRGDYVHYELDREGRLIYIEVLDEKEGEFEGTLKYITYGGPPNITIVTGSGLEMDYDVAAGATILRDGDEINLSDVIPGSRARILLKDGRVDELEVLDDRNLTVEGRVAGVNRDKWRLTLDIGGRNFTFPVMAGVVITGGEGESPDLAHLEGYMVEAQIKDGKIEKISVQ
ncbi:MAG TPA: S-layer homology domain-containing protein [Desulfotomaculum sp.]|nr:S-layer homology domain-containing protein [Desulfotomaculum sp.]